MKLTYTGPMDGLSLHDPEGKLVFEEVMWPGRTYDMPDTHPTVEAWRARELLIEPATEAAAEASPVSDISQVSREAAKVRQKRAEAPGAGTPPGEPQE